MKTERTDFSSPETAPPWQLAMFKHSLKKKQKLDALLNMLGDVNGQSGLLITCGDNNGALNWKFRQHGGNWTWAEVEDDNLQEISEFLDEPVHHIKIERFPFENDHFDFAVCIDVLEHINDDEIFLRELHRVLRQDGRLIITVPTGDEKLLANKIRTLVGITPEVLGHVKPGYKLYQLKEAVEKSGFQAIHQGGYSGFFTEMIELVINYGYVFLLSRKEKGERRGKIAPTSSGEFKAHGIAYKLYSLSFPILQLFSKLDKVVPKKSHYAVIVEAIARKKEGGV